MLLKCRDNGLNIEFFLHHVAALLLIGRGISKSVSRFVPHFLVCEFSTILLDVMWFMRQYGVASPLNKHFVLAALSFFSVFTLTRIVNMPLMMHAAFTTHRKDIEHFGYAKWTLLGVQALQLWWYYKIVRQFAPLISVGIALLRLKLASRVRLSLSQC